MHAQKLEAIGKLTGGVAHDFNNVLHIISGNIDLIKMFAMANEKIVARCQSAQSAIKRGAKLSSQLLSFARKQPLQPNAVKLDEVFANMDLLIKRAVGEKVDVILDIAPNAWNIKVDPQQLENVVLNLAMNAGEALKRGGELVISARNVILSPIEQAANGAESRECVRLSFSDNGDGMSAAVKERAFEPFFSDQGHRQRQRPGAVDGVRLRQAERRPYRDRQHAGRRRQHHHPVAAHGGIGRAEEDRAGRQRRGRQ